jgi:P4 family phage/plasmid primase-like protien
MMTLYEAARQYHAWGANVLAVKDKSPWHIWRGGTAKRPGPDWTTTQQTDNDVRAFPWRKATAVGVVNGPGDWHTFDLDKSPDEAPLLALLEALGLPDDYEWTWRSGSGEGWAVAFRCDEELPAGVLPAKKTEAGVFWGWPGKDSGLRFDHAELRWKVCQTVYPPSAYTFTKKDDPRKGQAGPGYVWRGAVPTEPPTLVSAARVIAAFFAIAPPPPQTLGSIDAATKDEIKRRFDLVAYAQRELGGEIQAEHGGEVRVLGHGGLLINPEKQLWHSFADDIGGDAFDLVGYARYSTIARNLNGKTAELLSEAAAWAGVTLPPRAAADTTKATTKLGSTPPIHMTDLGNARRLVRLHGHDLHYIHAWGAWLIWDGTRWVKDETGEIHRRARATVASIYSEAAAETDTAARKKLAEWAIGSESRARLDNMVTLAQSEPSIPIRHDALDADPFLLNCRNGTLDLRSGALRPHQRDDLLTKQAAVDYDPAAPCPRWRAFLDRAMGGNRDLMSFLQRAVGYSLTADVSEECLFFSHGKGKNGKTTFTETIMNLLADYAQKAPTEMLMLKQHGGGIPNDVARLPGARFVAAAETEEGRRLAESIVKDLTGGDTLAARFMRQEFFEFAPTHKFWIYGNHKPLIRGTDEGIWRRIRLIPFTVTIPPEERDPNLRAKLRKEFAGILAWAVQGCRDWQCDGLGEPAAVQQATDAYRNEMDVIGAFLGECCVIGPHYKAYAKALYEAYKAWCEANGEHAVNQRRYGGQLTERGLVNRPGTGHRIVWDGIGLVTSDPPGTHAPSEPSEGSEPGSHLTKKFSLARERKSDPGSLGSLGSLESPTDDAPARSGGVVLEPLPASLRSVNEAPTPTDDDHAQARTVAGYLEAGELAKARAALNYIPPGVVRTRWAAAIEAAERENFDASA